MASFAFGPVAFGDLQPVVDIGDDGSGDVFLKFEYVVQGTVEAVGALIIVGCWVAGVLLVMVVYGAMPLGELASDEQVDARIDSLVAMDSPEATIAFLISFFGIWVGVWIAGRLLHRQPFGSFFSPDRKFHAGQFLKGLALGVVPGLTIALALALLSDSVRPALSGADVARLFAPIAILVFLQATGEELLFRGYLLQQLVVRSRHWIVWAVLPSLAFGALHIDPELGGSGYYWGLNTFLFGLLACVLVWRSGSLWAASGLHVGVNLVAMTVLGADEIGSGTQLWVLETVDLEPYMQLDTVVSIVMLLIALSPAGRIFGPGGFYYTPNAFAR